MSEFDKWDKKNYSLPPTIERGPVGRDCFKQRKATWVAALKCMRNMLIKTPDDKIYEKIEQEISEVENEGD